MGILGKFGEKIGDIAKKVAPFGGRMLGLDKSDKEKFRPEQQFAGGSKQASNAMRDRYVQGSQDASATAQAGLDRTVRGANQARTDYGTLGLDAYYERQGQRGRSDARGTEANAAQAAAQKVADNQMAQDRRRIIGIADTANENYQRTADAQFRATQDANQNAALALGSRGGAAGLRAALAGSTVANQQAANQAQITNAQQFNDLMGQRVNAYGQANNISAQRAGVYGNLANLGAAREDAARNAAIQQQGIQGNAIANTFGAQAQAGAQQTGAGTAARGQYLGAESAQNAAELGAAREYEAQRQQNEKQNYTSAWYPLKSFNAPA